MKTDDPLCIPVDPHDYEHSDEQEPQSEEFVSLADARPAARRQASLKDRLAEWPGD
jgi:hypothetical protein